LNLVNNDNNEKLFEVEDNIEKAYSKGELIEMHYDILNRKITALKKGNIL
jgi:hypothetical protein